MQVEVDNSIDKCAAVAASDRLEDTESVNQAAELECVCVCVCVCVIALLLPPGMISYSTMALSLLSTVTENVRQKVSSTSPGFFNAFRVRARDQARERRGGGEYRPIEQLLQTVDQIGVDGVEIGDINRLANDLLVP